MSIGRFVTGDCLRNTVMRDFPGRIVTKGSRRFSFNPANGTPLFPLLQKYSQVKSCEGRRRCHTDANNGGGIQPGNVVALLGGALVGGALVSFLKTKFLSENERKQQELQGINFNLTPPPSKDSTFLTPIPGKVPKFAGRQMVLTKITDSLRNKLHNSEPTIEVIVGPRGIGKTQLVLEFLRQKPSYDYVLWFPCGKEKTIQETYFEIYVRLKIETYKLLLKTDHEEIMEEVKKALENHSCLWVFDNASDMQAIAPHLPRQGDVLITSSNSCLGDWDGRKPYSLEPFKWEEISSLASQFLADSKERTYFLNNLQRKVRCLPCYPSVLHELFSLLSKCPPKEFLTLIGKKETFLEALSNPNSSSEYAQSMKDVVERTLEELRAKPGGEDAIHLLSQLALFDHKDIPLKRLLAFSETGKTLSEDQVKDALQLLERDSLIRWNKKDESLPEGYSRLSSCITWVTKKEGISLDRTIKFIVRQHLFSENSASSLGFPSFSLLIRKLIDASNKGTIAEKAEKLEFLLPQGRMIFSCLEEEKKFSEEAAELASWLSSACGSLCFFEEKLLWAKEGLKIIEKLHENKCDPKVVPYLYSVGKAFEDVGNDEEALRYFRRALKMEEATPEKDLSKLATYLDAVGKALMYKGDEEALGYCERALRIRKSIYWSGDGPEVAQSLNSVGEGLFQEGKFKEAHEHFKEAYEMGERFYGSEPHPDRATFLMSVGRGLFQKGKFKEALGCFEQALKMRKITYKNTAHPHLATSLDSVGVALKMVDPEDNFGLKKRRLEMLKKTYKNEDHPRLTAFLDEEIKMVDSENSFELKERALRMRESIYRGRDHLDLAKSFSNVALGCGDKGLDERALNLHMKAVIMALRVYKKGHPSLDLYVDNFVNSLKYVADKGLINYAKNEIYLAYVETLVDNPLTNKIKERLN